MIKIGIDENKMYAIVENDIHNNVSDVVELINVQNEFLNSECKRLQFEFTDCKFMNAAISVIIGTLPAYARTQKRSVKYRFVEQNIHPILKFMKKVGMYKYYMDDEIDYTGDDIIPFNHIKDEDMMNEYASRILSMAPIKMQPEAQDILASYIIEIYQNGLFHSDSPIGVFTSGFWDKRKNEFTFSIYDMGVGIPHKIREYMDMPKLESEKCVKLAFLDGFTTSTSKEYNRGLGLARLERFIRLNNGSMTMYTDNICCAIDGNKEKEFIKLKRPIKGTLIVINIIADETHIYIVEKETKS